MRLMVAIKIIIVRHCLEMSKGVSQGKAQCFSKNIGDRIFCEYVPETLVLLFNLSVTLRDAPGCLYSPSVTPQVSWFHRVKNRNTATSLAKYIILVFPDVIETCIVPFSFVLVWVGKEFIVFHLAEVIPPNASSLCGSLN